MLSRFFRICRDEKSALLQHWPLIFTLQMEESICKPDEARGVQIDDRLISSVSSEKFGKGEDVAGDRRFSIAIMTIFCRLPRKLVIDFRKPFLKFLFHLAMFRRTYSSRDLLEEQAEERGKTVERGREGGWRWEVSQDLVAGSKLDGRPEWPDVLA